MMGQINQSLMEDRKEMPMERIHSSVVSVVVLVAIYHNDVALDNHPNSGLMPDP